MTIYYILLAAACVLSLLRFIPIRFSIKVGPKHSKMLLSEDVFLFLVFTFVTVIVGLRAKSVGIDTANYVDDFYGKVENGIRGLNAKIEILNPLLQWVCSLFSSNHQFYLLAHAAIISILFAKFIRDNSDDVYLSTIVFIGMFFVPSMNLMRQWLAMAIGLSALTFYNREEQKKALICIILAVLTHFTACVLFIIPIVERAKNKKRAIIPVILISIIVILFRVQIFSLSVRIMPGYSGYFTKSHFKNSGGFNIKNLIFLAIILAIAYVLIFYKDRLRDKKTENTMYDYLILMILALAFSLCGTTYMMFHRVAYYFSVFLVLIIPNVSQRFSLSKVIKLLAVAAMFVMLSRSGASDNNGISNYVWFWQ